jgi:2-phosphosulfolactate phosphatase
VTPQDAAAVRFEWGPSGAEVLAQGAAVAVVVDVLSFTTSVSVAADRGIEVHPYRWKDRGAEEYAAERGAVLAGRRGDPGGVSLSPASILAARDVHRLVLPSPNGSTLAARLAEGGFPVVAAALRNRRAVARWTAARTGRRGPVAVLAAGERWPDGSLRPAVEDLWGAGAVVAALLDLGIEDVSPEAAAAAAAFRALDDVAAGLVACTSGRELVARGFPEDVRLAAEVDVSDRVPVLVEGAFVAAPGTDGP